LTIVNYILQEPVVKVVQQDTTCVEGATVTFTAWVEASIPAIDTVGYTYDWSLKANDKAPLIVQPEQPHVATYTCSSVGIHPIYVLVKAAGTVYTTKPVITTSKLDVTNGLLKIGAVKLSYDATPDVTATTAYVGDLLKLVVPFSDASLDNTHTISVEWGLNDGSAPYTATELDPTVKQFIVPYMYPAASKAGAVFSIKITVTDSAAIPSKDIVYTDIAVSHSVSAAVLLHCACS
jgi:hypothetical protein